MNTEITKSGWLKFDAQSIGNAYRKAVEGKLTNSEIEEGLKSLNDSLRVFDKQMLAAAQTRYPAQGNVAALVAWARINVSVNGGKSTIGDGGGAYTPGGGAFWGDLYTDDINRLYRDSYSYHVSIAAAYMNVNFFDGNSNLLGSFHGGGIGIVSGTGGGRITQPWR